jgi:hypothetical protein
MIQRILQHQIVPKILNYPKILQHQTVQRILNYQKIQLHRKSLMFRLFLQIRKFLPVL